MPIRSNLSFPSVTNSFAKKPCHFIPLTRNGYRIGLIDVEAFILKKKRNTFQVFTSLTHSSSVFWHWTIRKFAIRNFQDWLRQCAQLIFSICCISIPFRLLSIIHLQTNQMNFIGLHFQKVLITDPVEKILNLFLLHQHKFYSTLCRIFYSNRKNINIDTCKKFLRR